MNKIKENVLKEYVDAYAYGVMYDKILHQDKVKLSDADKSYYQEKYYTHLSVVNAMLRCLGERDQRTCVPDKREEAVKSGNEMFNRWLHNNLSATQQEGA